ncbi:Putative enoyl-CoA hydratase EchA13 [Xylophilus ampelinus]|nr:crotonase/enoyl-CoA hydratase family protein [Variovorax sp.]VTY30510.1 Putative enoyl-CoA hydratase EchA13 [Xylophilus ampelinus]
MNRWLRSTDFLEFGVAEHVATVTLNRPEKRNALSVALLVELRNALLEADDRDDVRVVLLQGAGRDFCAGFDLDSAYGPNTRLDGGLDGPTYRVGSGADDECLRLERKQALMLTLREMHKPVVAKIHGNCLAGGTDLALMCDVLIASDDARIGYPATRANGTPPSNMWLYHVGPQWAKRLMFTGDCLSGLDAARIGLVCDAVPFEKLDAEVAHLVGRMAMVHSDLLSAHKRVINMGMDLSGTALLQRFAAETDARLHSASRAMAKFSSDASEHGVREAVRRRDAAFGDGMVKLSALGRSDR